MLLRRYQPQNQKPGFTVDLDLEAWKTNVSKAEETFKQAMTVDLKDSFKFSSVKKEPMKRETPYGVDRFFLNWSLF